MRTIFSVCGCTDPVDELATSLPLAKSARKSAGTKIQSTDPDIVKKLEELSQVKEPKPVTNEALQQKYNDLESNLNKCKDELRDLQSNSGIAAPQHLRSKYVSLGTELKRCKDELQALHGEAKVESLQKDLEALVKYRKEIEDELQKCWAQLKLFHLENQLASASSGL